MIDFWQTYGTEILLRTGEHILLVAVAMAGAIATGIPLGILIARRPAWAQWVLGCANTIQTIPSLAIFGFLITVPLIGGIGKIPAIFALSLYALLPIVRNTYIGLVQVDPGVKEAGLSMGMTPGQILRHLELPLALAAILTGIRVAAVICVGIATIAAAIGGGGLGVFIFRGIATVNNQIILAGAVPAAAIALLADGGIGLLERHLTERQRVRKRSRRLGWIGLGILACLLALAWGIMRQPETGVEAQGGTVTIGSKNFTEAVILGELLAQQIERDTDLAVDRRFNLGGTFICHEALKSGKIDGYVEYTGTALTAILKQPPLNDPRQVFRQVQKAYARLGLTAFPSLGFNNTFAIVIRQSDAEKYHLKTLSQAARFTPNWKAGFGYEFLARQDGFPGLAEAYGLKFADTPQAMELGLLYRALADRQVDLVAGNSTDGSIPVLNLSVLEDDRRYFPPYEAIPVFNSQTLQKYPQLRPVLGRLSNTLSAETMQRLNYQVDSQADSVEGVVENFLRSQVPMS